jgi:hypothetical protein
VASELGISSDTLWGWLHAKGSSGTGRGKGKLPERAREFRAALAALGRTGSKTTYPRELRALGLAHLKERRSQGVPLREVASELGIAKTTATRWERPARRASAIRRVNIAPRTTAPGTSMVVYGPAGLRIEGLDVATVAALLKDLS